MNVRKWLMEGLSGNLLDLEEPWAICLLTNETKITRGPTNDVLTFSPGFMLRMNFSFFNAESIREFTSNFSAICSANSYPFEVPSIIKRPTLYILKFIVTLLINQHNKVAFVRVDEDGALAKYSEFMKTCHDMNIIVQTIDWDASSLNGKS